MHVSVRQCMTNEQLHSSTDPRHQHRLWCSDRGDTSSRQLVKIFFGKSKRHRDGIFFWGGPPVGRWWTREVESESEYERVVNPRFGFRFKLEFELELF